MIYISWIEESDSQLGSLVLDGLLGLVSMIPHCLLGLVSLISNT